MPFGGSTERVNRVRGLRLSRGTQDRSLYRAGIPRTPIAPKALLLRPRNPPRPMASPSHDDRIWTVTFLCWLIACAGTLGSLFFSEVMELVPCSLCWYQRIFLFPLVFVLTVGLYPADGSAARYGLPLAIGGWLVAGYQNLLVWGLVSAAAVPCGPGVSCSEIDFALFGFITIPFLSWVAFTILGALLFYLKRLTRP